MKVKTSSVIMGVILIIYGLFRMLLFSQRDIFIGSAFVIYGMGTIMIATQKTGLSRIGIVINFVVLFLALAALLYEKFN